MSDQIHIRDGETVRLLRAMARQTGRSVTDIVREAARAYVPRPSSGPAPVDPRGLLASDRARLLPGAMESGPEDLYGPDGLPR